MEFLAPDVTIKELKKIITRRFTHRALSLKPLAIIGHKGLGKSTAVKQSADALGIQCVTLNLEALEAPDFSGLPYREDNTVKYSRPNFLPSEGSGILFMDEFNRCNRDIRTSLLSLLENREINGHKIGDDWIFVLAGNPSESEDVMYEVHELDNALIDRVAQVNLTPDIFDWLKYMCAHYGSENDLIHFVQSDPKMYDITGKYATSPRSLEYVAKLCQIPGKLDVKEVSAEIGKDAALLFFNFLLEGQLGEQFKHLSPDGLALPDKSQFIDALALAHKEANLAVVEEFQHKLIDDIRTNFTYAGTATQTITESVDYYTEYLRPYVENEKADLLLGFFIKLENSLDNATMKHFTDTVLTNLNFYDKIADIF